jgi:hypothetical protein
LQSLSNVELDSRLPFHVLRQTIDVAKVVLSFFEFVIGQLSCRFSICAPSEGYTSNRAGNKRVQCAKQSFRRANDRPQAMRTTRATSRRLHSVCHDAELAKKVLAAIRTTGQTLG